MTDDVHTLSGAYALDALSDREAADFREHLRGCQACRDEVRELRDAAARMAQAEAVAPPPTLRARVLTAAERTPQQPPPVAVVRHVPRRRRWLAAAAAAVIVVGGGIVGVNALTGDDDPALDAQVAEVFEADDARTATVSTENGGKLTVGVAPGNGEMAVDARELPELDDEHAYQLWTLQDGQATSAGVLPPDATGAAMPLPEGQTQVALTIEPAAGSEQPTTEPIVTVDPTEV